MSIIRTGFSAIGKLLLVVVLAGTFLAGLVGVVYLSLQGEELKVPEITGKDFVESERELAQMGLKIKRRADRYSTEKPNTILEQLPKPGETVKTGQMILVVTSNQNGEGGQEPTTIKKITEEEGDAEKIEEMISDKPKKTNANKNANKKKADTKRDVIGNNANSNGNSAASVGNSNAANNPADKANKTVTIAPGGTKPAPTAPKPPPAKPPGSGGDVRPRTTAAPKP